MKNIIISGYYGFDNIGDEAILSSMIKQIKNKIPDCNIIVISGNIEETKRLHEVDAINRYDFVTIGHNIEKCDLVILGGGGLFQDNHKIDISNIFTQPGYGTASYVIVPLMAKMHNKLVIYYSQGIGPLFSKESKTFVSFASEVADIITVRDIGSRDLLIEIGVQPSKIILSADPAINLDIISSEKTKNIFDIEKIPSTNIICICIREWIDKTLEENYKTKLSEGLDNFLNNNNFNLVFVPFQQREDNNDLKISKEVIEKMENKDRCYILKGSYSPQEIAGIISKSDLVIGMRYHSIIFSIISKIPFVALSYDPKVKNLVQELGLEEYCIDIDLINSKDVNNAVIKALENKEKIQKMLESSIIDMRNRLEFGSGIINKFIEYSNDDFIIDIPIIEKMRLLNMAHKQIQIMNKIMPYLYRQLKDKDDTISRFQDVITDLESQLNNKNNTISRFQDVITDLESQLNNKNNLVNDLEEKFGQKENQIESNDIEISRLQEILRQREDSLSWRFSQFYGAYFKKNSYVTRFVSHFLNKFIHTTVNNGSIVVKDNNNRYKQELIDILKEREKKIKGIIIYPPTVDWNIPLFQRPQQLALELSDLGYLFFFSTGSNEFDKVDGFYKINDNCHITNQYDLLIRELPEFIFMLSSTNLVISLEDIIKIKEKTLIIYEYIDEIHQDISGPISIDYALRRHGYMIKNSDIVIVTADKLLDDVKKIREKDVYIIPNGVDYEHFHIQKDDNNIPEDIRKIIKKGNPIIGYYGALAKWFDYELVKEIAKKRHNYEIVLIGWDYDGSMHNQHLEDFKNIHYLGIKKYPVLSKYAVWFDIATIPFVLNKITESTSPIKIFEYMALGKPIVTTDMRECRKYKSVLIGKDYDEFIEKIDDSLKLRSDPHYVELLDNEAKENTWKFRAEKIDKIVQLKLDVNENMKNKNDN